MKKPPVSLARALLTALNEDTASKKPSINEEKWDGKETADEQYRKRYVACRTLLNDIEKGLEEHRKKQSSDKKNWGYSGDLGRLREQLENITEWLG